MIFWRRFARAARRRRRSDLGRLTSVLVARTRSADEFTRVTAVTWLREFVSLAGRAASVGTHVGTPLVSRFADILGAVLPCLSHAEPKVRDVAEKASDELLAAAVDAARGRRDDDVTTRKIGKSGKNPAETLAVHLLRSARRRWICPACFRRWPGRRGTAGEPTMLASLRWYAHLVHAAPARARSLILRGRDVRIPTIRIRVGVCPSDFRRCARFCPASRTSRARWRRVA